MQRHRKQTPDCSSDVESKCFSILGREVRPFGEDCESTLGSCVYWRDVTDGISEHVERIEENGGDPFERAKVDKRRFVLGQ